jgi:DNA polymerase-3 subunit gamma/tau
MSVSDQAPPAKATTDPLAEGPALPGFEPEATSQTPYRVLARKYRPQTFDDLIGQEAMVRTLSNAFAAGRIPQAWILTGVRGVGKTTTARILARGLNYETAAGGGAPTVVMPMEGVHCRAIIESRHIDVLEMDAASHTSVDDVRQINDSVRYAPVSARYKVYIIDEVHMLSKSAFNAFLKTLEEPPPHAKFIFATTDIRSVPVTILSRCQRFDLRRVEADTLIAHLQRICTAEGIDTDAEALSMIARASEGSVRDALSLLDQAIAYGGEKIEAESVRQMLGLADRGRMIDLFEAVMAGDIVKALQELRAQYDQGADPATVIGDLAGFTHFVTRLKVVPEAAQDGSVSLLERERGLALTILPMRELSRCWQMLLKGHREVQDAARPMAAAEMLLIRLAYAAELPTPDDAIRASENSAQQAGSAPILPRGGGGGASASAARLVVANPQEAPRAVGAAHAAPVMRIDRFEDLVALATEKRDIMMKRALESEMRLVRFEDGKLEFAPVSEAPQTLAAEIGRKLQAWTGRRWIIAISNEKGAETLRAIAEREAAAQLEQAKSEALVQAVLQQFPGARVIDVRETEQADTESVSDVVLQEDDEFDFTLLDQDSDA